jgi:hypothetical protein
VDRYDHDISRIYRVIMGQSDRNMHFQGDCPTIIVADIREMYGGP